jgi:hypothetical protein
MSLGFGHWMSKWRKWHFYGVSSLIDPDYAAWTLKMTSAALNLHVGQQLKHQPDVGKQKLCFDSPEILVLSTFVVSIAFLIFSRRFIKCGL